MEEVIELDAAYFSVLQLAGIAETVGDYASALRFKVDASDEDARRWTMLQQKAMALATAAIYSRTWGGEATALYPTGAMTVSIDGVVIGRLGDEADQYSFRFREPLCSVFRSVTRAGARIRVNEGSND